MAAISAASVARASAPCAAAAAVARAPPALAARAARGTASAAAAQLRSLARPWRVRASRRPSSGPCLAGVSEREAGHLATPPWSRASRRAASTDILAARTLAACGYPADRFEAKRRGKPAKAAAIPAGTPYSKELRLLAHVLETATPGDAMSVCEAIENFGKNVLNPAGQWLKVAGDAKALVLTSAMRGKPRQGSILEIGCYCGYSALRMSLALPGTRIVTLEVDPAHVVIARNIVAFAGRAHYIDVWTGHSKDLLTRLPDRYGGVEKWRIGGVFMDQRGSRYDEDLATLERLGILLPGAVVVADNVLKPGSPLFLWRLKHGGTYDTEIVRLTEFAMPAEDWMSVSVRRADAPLGAVQGRERGEASGEAEGRADPTGEEAPQELAQLQWEADRMRAQATRVPGVTFQEWAAFSDHMKEGMGRHGIADSVDAAQLETEPWLVLGPHGSPPDAAMEARAAEEEAAREEWFRGKDALSPAVCVGC